MPNKKDQCSRSVTNGSRQSDRNPPIEHAPTSPTPTHLPTPFSPFPCTQPIEAPLHGSLLKLRTAAPYACTNTSLTAKVTGTISIRSASSLSVSLLCNGGIYVHFCVIHLFKTFPGLCHKRKNCKLQTSCIFLAQLFCQVLKSYLHFGDTKN
jgi:hypothetical protein